MTSLCCKVLEALAGKTLATAESCTGGGIGAALTAIPGSSAVYKGGIISYTNWVKHNLLGVDQHLLDTLGAVSAPVAEAMAKGAREAIQADIAVSVTGLAGPGGDEFGNPVGLVFIGYSDAGKTLSRRFLFPGSREEIRQNAYNLNIPRYVDSSEKAEQWEVYATMFGGIPMTEISELDAYWNAFPNLKEALFTDVEAPYTSLVVDEIREAIKNHPDVKAFEAHFEQAFASFGAYLKEELIQKMSDDTYLVEGSMKLDDINDALGTDLTSEDYDSIGGLIIDCLDRLPEDGEEVTLENGIHLKVQGIDQNRIIKVLMTIPEPAEEHDAGSAEISEDHE